MDSAVIVTRFLFGALALVMFGLGLSLTAADFQRLLKHPKAVMLALGLQVIGLPLACYAIITAFGLPPVFAIGLMLLAASPGGHLGQPVLAPVRRQRGDEHLADRREHTAVHRHPAPHCQLGHRPLSQSGQVVPMQTSKLLEVIAIVLIPVLLGMAVARKAPGFSNRMEKPVKIFSAVVLAVVTVLAIAKEWGSLSTIFVQIGPAVLLFNLVSLFAGYYLSRAAGLDKPLSTAICYEIGIHNSTLAIFVAQSVLGSYQLAMPAAVYSVVMYITAPLFGWLVLKRRG